jgi:hypothetical protein
LFNSLLSAERIRDAKPLVAAEGVKFLGDVLPRCRGCVDRLSKMLALGAISVSSSADVPNGRGGLSLETRAPVTIQQNYYETVSLALFTRPGTPASLPTTGSQQVLINDWGTAWDVTWTPGTATPMHRHASDLGRKAGPVCLEGDRPKEEVKCVRETVYQFGCE